MNEVKKEIYKPILIAAIIVLIYYAIEIPMVLLDIFPNQYVMFGVDIVLRIFEGIAALLALNWLFRINGDKNGLKQVFTNKVSKQTIIFTLPVLLYCMLPFLKVPAGQFTTQALPVFILIAIQQLATGFGEEAVSRGLVMNGLLKHNTNTVKQRLLTAFISGAFFGMIHLPNIAFGDNPLIQVPACAATGFFFGALYLLSKNLPLVMLLHTLMDLTSRIVGWLFKFETQPDIVSFISVARDVIDYAVLPIMAVLICVFYEKLKKKEN